MNEPLEWLNSSIDSRLLQTKVETEDILGQVLISIPVLRLIDPTCFILDRAIQRIRGYLKKRKEFAGEIVKMIRSLAMEEEFRNGVKVFYDNPEFDQINYSMDTFNDPPEAGSECIRKSSKIGDAFTVLANLAEDPEILLTEYKKNLVKMLIYDEADVDEVMAEVELFKSKFGNALWETCDVILKDFVESRKFNGDGCLDVVIASHLYWPKMEINSELRWPLYMKP